MTPRRDDRLAWDAWPHRTPSARLGPIVLVVFAAAVVAVILSTNSTTALLARVEGGATSVTPSRSDLAALGRAFDGVFELPPTCSSVVTAGSYRFAVDQSGRGWAYATLSPAPTCRLMEVGQKPVTNLATAPPFDLDPTGRTAVSLRYTFERTHGRWQINAGSGTPFPCPTPKGRPAGGDRNGSFPEAVLRAWGLHDASGCADVYYDEFPH